MELCEGGELADVLREKEIFSESDTKVIMKKMFDAISYLHKKGKYLSLFLCPLSSRGGIKFYPCPSVHKSYSMSGLGKLKTVSVYLVYINLSLEFLQNLSLKIKIRKSVAVRK